MSFWMDKLQSRYQPAATPDRLPPSPAEHDADEPDISEEQWRALNAKRVETGSDFALVSASKRTWDGWDVQTDRGIFGKIGRRTQAQLHEAVRSGKFNEATGDDNGSPWAQGQLVRDITGQGCWQLAKGLDGPEGPSVPTRFA